MSLPIMEQTMTRCSDSGNNGTMIMFAKFTSASSKKMFVAFAGAATLLLTSGYASAAKTEYPLTIKHCGSDITFHQTPEHVATVAQHSP